VRHDDIAAASGSTSYHRTSNGNSTQHPALLVREGGSQRGRDEPALAMKHCIDITLMQVCLVMLYWYTAHNKSAVIVYL
jgi:hypothetical protein